MLVISSLGVTLIIVALVAVITADVHKNGSVSWIGALRQWQTLLGTLIGFATAAGILALNTAFQDDEAARREAEAMTRIERALAIEAKNLNGVLDLVRQAITGAIMRGANTARTPATGCDGQIVQLHDALQRTTPIYSAAIPKLVDYGDPNLSVFVNFYSTYSDIVRDSDVWVGEGCPVAGHETIDRFLSRMDDAAKSYAEIAKIYDPPPPK